LYVVRVTKGKVIKHLFWTDRNRERSVPLPNLNSPPTPPSAPPVIQRVATPRFFLFFQPWVSFVFPCRALLGGTSPALIVFPDLYIFSHPPASASSVFRWSTLLVTVVFRAGHGLVKDQSHSYRVPDWPVGTTADIFSTNLLCSTSLTPVCFSSRSFFDIASFYAQF
jgi:hypothetical protein